jgi:hypothetical protein
MQFRIRRGNLVPNLMLALPALVLLILLLLKGRVIADDVIYSRDLSIYSLLVFFSLIGLVTGIYLQFVYLASITVDDAGIVLASPLKRKRIRWDAVRQIEYQFVSGTNLLILDLGRKRIEISDCDHFLFDIANFWRFACLLAAYKSIIDKDTGKPLGGGKESG